MDKTNFTDSGEVEIVSKRSHHKAISDNFNFSIVSQIRFDYENMTFDVRKVADIVSEHDHKYSMAINSCLLF